MLKLPDRAFWEYYAGAAFTFALLVALTAFNPLLGGTAWIIGGLALAWLEFGPRGRNR